MKVGIWLAVIAASVVLALLEGYCSWKYDQSFFKSQVWDRWHQAGIPLSMHGGWWSDILILPIAFALVVWYRADTWSWELVAIMVAIGFAVSLANHLLLITGQPLPDPFGWMRFKWSTAIGLHFVYFAIYTALIGLFFFSKDLPWWAVVAMAVLVGIHVALGTHVPLGIIERWVGWKEIPDLIASPPLPWMNLSVWLLLAGLATYAGDWKAGVTTLGIGGFFASVVVLLVASGPPPAH